MIQDDDDTGERPTISLEKKGPAPATRWYKIPSTCGGRVPVIVSIVHGTIAHSAASVLATPIKKVQSLLLPSPFGKKHRARSFLPSFLPSSGLLSPKESGHRGFFVCSAVEGWKDSKLLASSSSSSRRTGGPARLYPSSIIHHPAAH